MCWKDGNPISNTLFLICWSSQQCLRLLGQCCWKLVRELSLALGITFLQLRNIAPLQVSISEPKVYVKFEIKIHLSFFHVLYRFFLSLFCCSCVFFYSVTLRMFLFFQLNFSIGINSSPTLSEIVGNQSYKYNVETSIDIKMLTHRLFVSSGQGNCLPKVVVGMNPNVHWARSQTPAP